MVEVQLLGVHRHILTNIRLLDAVQNCKTRRAPHLACGLSHIISCGAGVLGGCAAVVA